MKYTEKIEQLRTELVSNSDIKLNTWTCEKFDNQALLSDFANEIQLDLSGTHWEQINLLEFEWTQSKLPVSNIAGSCRLLSIDTIKQIRQEEWQNFIEEQHPVLTDFYPIDFYTGDVCIGIYRGYDNLHLYGFGYESVSLNIGLRNYLDFVIASKGLLYWQEILVDISVGKFGREQGYYNEMLSNLFPDSKLPTIQNTFDKLTK